MGDIAFDQPTIIKLVLNQATASVICLRIAQSLLLRAEEVIQ